MDSTSFLGYCLHYWSRDWGLLRRNVLHRHPAATHGTDARRLFSETCRIKNKHGKSQQSTARLTPYNILADKPKQIFILRSAPNRAFYLTLKSSSLNKVIQTMQMADHVAENSELR
jgi:hypothetical protein